jgi:hypothetical protein
LFVGACFGVGYGVTQRLMRVNVSGAWQGNQLFGVQPFPGTALSGLRERFGAEKMEIRGDLDDTPRHFGGDRDILLAVDGPGHLDSSVSASQDHRRERDLRRRP